MWEIFYVKYIKTLDIYTFMYYNIEKLINNKYLFFRRIHNKERNRTSGMVKKYEADNGRIKIQNKFIQIRT